MSTPVALDLDAVEKRYGGRAVLDGLTLHVNAGERVGLLGPNGVGKSTALRACAGLVAVSSGAVHVFGLDPMDVPVQARAKLGYVPDVGGLFPRLTGREHLELVARLHRLGDGWQTRSGALLERLFLDEAADERSSAYSHGMSRKLALAMAVLHSPSILLLDEPFDGVDPAGSRAIRDLVDEETQRGCAVLCSTHLLDVADRFCERLVILAGGKVVAEGTGDELRGQTSCETLEDAYLALAGP
jgi:ABC-2 type transport system ATP-binding protein